MRSSPVRSGAAVRPWRLGALARLAASLLAAALGAAACADAPAGEAPSEATGVAALTVSDDGVGPLGARTRFDTAAVRAALPPGFSVDVRSAPLAGASPIAAFADGLLALDAYPDASGNRLARIDVLSEQARGPGGVRVGQSFAETGGAALSCAPGEGDLAGRAVCTPEGHARVRLVYAYGAAEPGVLPPLEALGGAILERIVWRAAP
ncbi:MAG: DUF1131 family protein [Rubricoccaceae bacterium]